MPSKGYGKMRLVEHATGRKGLKRFGKTLRVGESAITRSSVKRLARRAGVKRMSHDVVDEISNVLRTWLAKIIHDASIYTEHAKRSTVILNDILFALKRNGITLYGFAASERRRRLVQPLQREELTRAAQRVAIRLSPTPMDQLPEPSTTQASSAQQTLPDLLSQQKSATISSQRSGEIQDALAHFRDAVIARQLSSDAPVSRITEWCAAFLTGRNRQRCASQEVMIVLEALQEKNAIQLEDGGNTAWFL